MATADPNAPQGATTPPANSRPAPSQPPQRPADEEEEGPSTMMKILGGVLLLLVLFGGGYLLVRNGNTSMIKNPKSAGQAEAQASDNKVLSGVLEALTHIAIGVDTTNGRLNKVDGKVDNLINRVGAIETRLDNCLKCDAPKPAVRRRTPRPAPDCPTPRTVPLVPLPPQMEAEPPAPAPQPNSDIARVMERLDQNITGLREDLKANHTATLTALERGQLEIKQEIAARQTVSTTAKKPHWYSRGCDDTKRPCR